MKAKKTTILLFLIFSIIKLSAQYDYFKWSGNATYNPIGIPSASSGITVDQYERVFYINGTDLNCIYWQYGKLLSSAFKAKSNSNLVHIPDAIGDHLFYIRSDNKIGLIEYLYTNGTWTNNNSYVTTDVINSQMSINAVNTNQIFYVRAADNKLCNFWKTTTTQGFGPLNTLAPSVAVGSNIVIKGNRVYYITSTRQLGCLEWNGSTWNLVTFQNAPAPNSIALNSKIQVDGDNSNFSIFYVSLDNKISQYFSNTNPGIGSGFAVLLQAAPNVLSQSSINLNSYNECRYIGVDGNIQALFWNGCGWSNYKLTNSNNISFKSFVQTSDNKILYYSSPSFIKLYNTSETSGFVYKKRDKLYLNNTFFTPIGINYISRIYSTDGGNTFFNGPDGHYANDFTNPTFNTQTSCQTVFDQHLAEMASLGFNSIRFNGLELISNPNDNTDPDLYILYKDPTYWWNPLVLKKVDQTVIDNLFNLYDYVLGRAANYNLKVKFFIGLSAGQRNTNCQNNYTEYLKKFAQRYKNNNTIYSYAIFQEADNNPRIHDTDASAFRGKGDICYYINQHYNAIRTIDANHLISMSLINSLSAITFDPYILNVDFLSFHPYPDLSNLSDNTYEEVRREINWISNVMKPIGKPWIIGETSFPGYSLTSNIQNTGTYQQQKDYAKFVLDEAFSAGASGLAWWQYKNVFWPGIIPNCCADTSLTAIYPSIQNWHNSENYYGVKAHDGSLKPIVGGSGLPITNNVFMNYQVNMGCSCLFPSNNYYQSISNPLYTINGIVKDVNQNLVKDALIIGWDGSWNSNKVTYTKSDGSFSLQSNFLISSMKICGLGFINSEQNSPISGLTYTISPVSCGQGNARIANNIDINDEKEMSGEFILYPNPNNGTFSITSEKVKETFNVEVYNNLGRLVFEKENNDPEKSNFSISELPKGIYIVILTTNSFSEKKKIIIF